MRLLPGPSEGDSSNSCRKGRMGEAAFAVDCMLGRLAKWLRIFGFDTFYSSRADDTDLLEAHKSQGRFLLTRDRGLLLRADPGRCALIKSDHLQRQLVEVVEALGLGLKPERFFTRCLLCNTPLEVLAKADAAGKVPDFVFLSSPGFSICRACGKVYWRGSHTDGVRTMIDRLGLSGFLPHEGAGGSGLSG